MGGWRSRPRNRSDVSCRHSENSGDGVVGFGEGGFLFRQVHIPGLGVPNLSAGAGTNHCQLPAKACVLPKGRRDSHPPLLVRYLVRGSGEKNTNVVTSLLVGDGSLPDLLMNLREFLLAKDIDAALLASRENKSAGKFLTELGGKNDPPLFVQTRRVCPQEHIPPPVCRQKPNNPALPLPSYVLHFTPLLPTVNATRRILRRLDKHFPRLFRGLARGGKWRGNRGAVHATHREMRKHNPRVASPPRCRAQRGGRKGCQSAVFRGKRLTQQFPARRWEH